MKISKILWIIIIFIIIGWIYYLFISPYIFKPKEYEVPNIIGLKENDAISILEDERLQYKLNYISGENEIVSHTLPKAGSKIYKDYIINIYITKRLPSYYHSFVGLIYDNNIDLINEFCNKHNIILNVIYELNNNYVSGQIFDQSKKSNELIEDGSELTIKIAVCDEFISMPNLVDMNIYKAMEILDSYNLKYNIIYYNSPIDRDIIISQSIAVGQLVKKGNNNYFNIYVSNGLC